MDEVQITLRMPRALWDAGSRLATRRGVPLEQMLRQMLSADLLRAKGTLAPPPIAQLRGQTSDDFDNAANWQELQGRLMVKGYAVRSEGSDLVLYSHPGGQRMCDLAKIGYTQEALENRFGSAFPNQTRRNLVDTMMSAKLDPRRGDPLAKWQRDTPEVDPTKRTDRGVHRLTRRI